MKHGVQDAQCVAQDTTFIVGKNTVDVLNLLAMPDQRRA